MIQITAYLRTEDDLVKWKTIPNKTEWLHERLSGVAAVQAAPPVAVKIDDPKPVLDSSPNAQAPTSPARLVAEQVVNLQPSVLRPNLAVCKIHGTFLDGRGRCGQKGCKYGY